MSNYLILEDNNDKVELIINEFIECNISKDSITVFGNVKQALNEIKKKKFNIVILDLNLPHFENETPRDNGGLIFLEKLKGFPERYFKPAHIIGLTSFSKLLKEQLTHFNELDFSLYDLSENGWKTALKNKIKWDIDYLHTKKRYSETNVVIAIHGIRTLGKWQDNLEPLFKKLSPEISYKKYKYNYYSAAQLLNVTSRERVINYFVTILMGVVNDYPDAKFHFISHSFGTYILIKSLERLPLNVEITIGNIILAGSVMRENYDWRDFKERHSYENIVNDCGYNDSVLLLCNLFCLDMGKAGRSGFSGIEIKNRYFKGGHSFFERQNDFMERYWLPVFKSNSIEDNDERFFSGFRENLEIIISSKLSLILFLFLLMVILYFCLWY